VKKLVSKFAWVNLYLYLKGWFLVDVASILPFDTLTAASGGSHHEVGSAWLHRHTYIQVEIHQMSQQYVQL
jgi:hypothetical protein